MHFFPICNSALVLAHISILFLLFETHYSFSTSLIYFKMCNFSELTLFFQFISWWIGIKYTNTVCLGWQWEPALKASTTGSSDRNSTVCICPWQFFVIIQGCFYRVSTQGLSGLRWCNCCIIVHLANDHAVPKRLHRERKKYIPEWDSFEQFEPRSRQCNFSVFLLFRQIAGAF